MPPAPPRLQIVVGRAHTVDGQMDLLLTVGAKMVEEPYKLLIVDSVMALFRWVGKMMGAFRAGGWEGNNGGDSSMC